MSTGESRLLAARHSQRLLVSKFYANNMRTTGWLLVLVCAVSVTAPAQEAASGDDATAIRALEHEWVQAQAHNDNGALDLIFDNALVYIDSGRLMTKGDYLLSIKSTKTQLLQIVMETMTVRMLGHTAIVVGTYRESGAKDGKALVKRWRFVDTWVYEKGRWMLVAAAAVPTAK